ncbi:neprosin family prolyl endopeptidase [Streptomyces hygroscopicus]|uniref:neprosin family prolyl endopeptidase n=1 Tax=Streptomyces hygroscopicus TaxID=1912 RepID=UPI00223EC2C4|nr:neprosin family prolyl endopeptidase [Streptomyces hygroscopicus]
MRIRHSIARTAATLPILFGLLGVAPTAPTGPLPPVVPSASASAGYGPICWYGSCFDYVTGRQKTDAGGASIQMFQASPQLYPGDIESHSLQELAVQSSDQKSTVEIGWTVDLGLNGDLRPHLFVYHWVDGQESCYNGCGFVRLSRSVRPGMAVRTGRSAQYAIEYLAGDWWVFYNRQAVGYFPGSLWGGTFTRGQTISAFGEVAHATGVTCEAMGDGVDGSASGSSWISTFQLLDSADPSQLTVTETSPELYDSGSVTPTSFHLGGPGNGPC